MVSGPDDPQPLYPDPHDFLTHTRLGGRTRFRPIETTKTAKPKKRRTPKAAARPKHPHVPAKRTAHRPLPARGSAHSAHRTQGRASPFSKRQEGPVHDVQFWALQDQNEQMWAVLIPRALGAGCGYSQGHISAPGHHPQATGRPRHTAEGAHVGTIRRALVLGYNSVTGYAVVRDADSPDSPGVSVRVSPAVSSAAMASATMAGIALWDTGDPTDALVSTVL